MVSKRNPAQKLSQPLARETVIVASKERGFELRSHTSYEVSHITVITSVSSILRVMFQFECGFLSSCVW